LGAEEPQGFLETTYWLLIKVRIPLSLLLSTIIGCFNFQQLYSAYLVQRERVPVESENFERSPIPQVHLVNKRSAALLAPKSMLCQWQ
jgi:hypothetical protein